MQLEGLQLLLSQSFQWRIRGYSCVCSQQLSCLLNRQGATVDLFAKLLHTSSGIGINTGSGDTVPSPSSPACCLRCSAYKLLPCIRHWTTVYLQ